MSIPNKGWLPLPLNGPITQFTLPEVLPVYYYLCNPGPYDPLQPWEKPQIEFININEEPFADSGWKNGAWGWVAGIHWGLAYGDALIESVWPPDEPTSFDERCIGADDVTDDACPPDLSLILELNVTSALSVDARSVVTIADEFIPGQMLVVDALVQITLADDDRPA